MPTGYTYPIKDNESYSFNEFVWDCARQFLIECKEDGSPIPLIKEPGDYHKIELENARKVFNEVSSWSDIKWESEYFKEIKENNKYKKEIKQNDAETRKRYERMLQTVKNWTPPTKTHEGIKEFMEEQIESSIKFDCGTSDFYEKHIKRETREAFRDRKLNNLIRDIKYHEDGYKKEVEQTNRRNEWVKKLHESVPMPEDKE